MRTLAVEAIKRKVITRAERRICEMHGATALCRQAMKAKTANNLPFAQPIGGDGDRDNVEWKQIELFTYEQAVANLERRKNGIIDDYGEYLRMHRWCFDKFGKAPELLELREPATT